MKLLLCSLLITAGIYVHAQTLPDSSINLDLATLNLTPEQNVALKKLIWEYKLEERKRRMELRHQMFLILNVRQQAAVRRWWRSQIKHSLKKPWKK
jgi:hypothetical protein